MRVIAGKLGGRRLSAPSGTDTRPTSDRVREAIFSILGPPPAGARVLDLFAGAGALGIEALSRGAAEAVFVDRAVAALACLGKNLGALGLTACEVRRGDALRLLPRLAGRFDWVFLDPPYASDLCERALAGLADGARLGPDPVVVAEYDRRRPPAPEHGCLLRTDERRYGDTCVAFYRRGER